MDASQPPRHPEAGFTLVETLVAATLLLLGIGATLTLLGQANATTVTNRDREQGTALQRELVEAARAVPYDQLQPGSTGAAVRTRPALADSTLNGSGWTIRRRGVTYTVSMGVCTVDDSRDGTGARTAGVFCAATGAPPSPATCRALITSGSGAGSTAGQCGIDANLDGVVDGLTSSSATVCTGSVCSSPADDNPADYKRVVSLVRWPGGYNLQTTQLNDPGSSAAPAVTALKVTPATLSSPMQQAITLDAEVSGAVTSVQTYRDGTAAAAATSTVGGAWTSTWNLGGVTTATGAQPAEGETLDSTYQLSAKAFDAYGRYGATKTETVVVNRREHFAPARMAAGRNGTSVVELEWGAAKEGDSAGFVAYRRVGGGTWTVVCALAVRTSCRDTAAPPASLGTVEYSVVGFDRATGGALRAGDRSAVAAVDPVQPTPSSPASLTAMRSGADVTLAWTPSGDTTAPDHYNIYRDGTEYTARHDSVYPVDGQPLTYVDPGAGPGRTYWITAVNAQLGESPAVGPVTP